MKGRKKRVFTLENSEINFLKAVGKNVATLSAKKGASIEHLAYEAGVSKGYLYDIVKGNGNPTVIILHRLATALDVEPWSLLKF